MLESWRFSVFFATLFVPFSEPVVLPPSFKICPRDHPNLAQCVRDSIEAIRPKLKNGDFGHGFVVDPLEPLRIDDILIKRGDDFYINIAQLQALGATNFKIDKLRINIDNFKIDAVVTVPKIEAYGLYKLKMMLGVLNINGEGKMKAILGDLKLRITLTGSKYIKNGEQYVNADNAQVTIKIPQIKLILDNLFNGDKVLSDLGNTVVNQNIDMFKRDIKPVLERSLAKHFLKTANQILEKASFNAFLP